MILKMTNRRFATQFEKYHDTDHAVLRVEEGFENTSDEYLAPKEGRATRYGEEHSAPGGN